MQDCDKDQGLTKSHCEPVPTVCPSKLSRRELEDLYFNVLQSNVELKKKVNHLTDTNRILNTKLQRLSETHRIYSGKGHKDSCTPMKMLIEDQRVTITELQKTNDRLRDQVKSLNMKLCSVKQFLKRNQPMYTNPNHLQCFYTSANTSVYRRNASTSAIFSKKSQDKNLLTQTKSVSCQNLDKLGLVNKSVGTDTNCCPPRLCDENKCRTHMEELEQKIVNLKQELSKTHKEYMTRIARLESEVIELHEERMRARIEQAARAHSNDHRESIVKEVRKKLRESEELRDDLKNKLIIEKNKVKEMQTQMKASNMVHDAVRKIELQLGDNNRRRFSKDSPNVTLTQGTSTVQSLNPAIQNESIQNLAADYEVSDPSHRSTEKDNSRADKSIQKQQQQDPIIREMLKRGAPVEYKPSLKITDSPRVEMQASTKEDSEGSRRKISVQEQGPVLRDIKERGVVTLDKISENMADSLKKDSVSQERPRKISIRERKEQDRVTRDTEEEGAPMKYRTSLKLTDTPKKEAQSFIQDVSQERKRQVSIRQDQDPIVKEILKTGEAMTEYRTSLEMTDLPEKKAPVPINEVSQEYSRVDKIVKEQGVQDAHRSDMKDDSPHQEYKSPETLQPFEIEYPQEGRVEKTSERGQEVKKHESISGNSLSSYERVALENWQSRSKTDSTVGARGSTLPYLGCQMSVKSEVFPGRTLHPTIPVGYIPRSENASQYIDKVPEETSIRIDRIRISETDDRSESRLNSNSSRNVPPNRQPVKINGTKNQGNESRVLNDPNSNDIATSNNDPCKGCFNKSEPNNKGLNLQNNHEFTTAQDMAPSGSRKNIQSFTSQHQPRSSIDEIETQSKQLDSEKDDVESTTDSRHVPNNYGDQHSETAYLENWRNRPKTDSTVTTRGSTLPYLGCQMSVKSEVFPGMTLHPTIPVGYIPRSGNASQYIDKVSEETSIRIDRIQISGIEDPPNSESGRRDSNSSRNGPPNSQPISKNDYAGDKSNVTTNQGTEPRVLNVPNPDAVATSNNDPFKCSFNKSELNNNSLNLQNNHEFTTAQDFAPPSSRNNIQSYTSDQPRRSVDGIETQREHPNSGKTGAESTTDSRQVPNDSGKQHSGSKRSSLSSIRRENTSGRTNRTTSFCDTVHPTATDTQVSTYEQPGYISFHRAGPKDASSEANYKDTSTGWTTNGDSNGVPVDTPNRNALPYDNMDPGGFRGLSTEPLQSSMSSRMSNATQGADLPGSKHRDSSINSTTTQLDIPISEKSDPVSAKSLCCVVTSCKIPPGSNDRVDQGTSGPESTTTSAVTAGPAVSRDIGSENTIPYNPNRRRSSGSQCELKKVESGSVVSRTVSQEIKATLLTLPIFEEEILETHKSETPGLLDYTNSKNDTLKVDEATNIFDQGPEANIVSANPGNHSSKETTMKPGLTDKDTDWLSVPVPPCCEELVKRWPSTKYDLQEAVRSSDNVLQCCKSLLQAWPPEIVNNPQPDATSTPLKKTGDSGTPKNNNEKVESRPMIGTSTTQEMAETLEPSHFTAVSDNERSINDTASPERKPDDSGYGGETSYKKTADDTTNQDQSLNSEEDPLNKVNQALLDKIADLQSQLRYLRNSITGSETVPYTPQVDDQQSKKASGSASAGSSKALTGVPSYETYVLEVDNSETAIATSEYDGNKTNLERDTRRSRDLEQVNRKWDMYHTDAPSQACCTSTKICADECQNKGNDVQFKSCANKRCQKADNTDAITIQSEDKYQSEIDKLPAYAMRYKDSLCIQRYPCKSRDKDITQTLDLKAERKKKYENKVNAEEEEKSLASRVVPAQTMNFNEWNNADKDKTPRSLQQPSETLISSIASPSKGLKETIANLNARYQKESAKSENKEINDRLWEDREHSQKGRNLRETLEATNILNLKNTQMALKNKKQGQVICKCESSKQEKSKKKEVICACGVVETSATNMTIIGENLNNLKTSRSFQNRFLKGQYFNFNSQPPHTNKPSVNDATRANTDNEKQNGPLIRNNEVLENKEELFKPRSRRVSLAESDSPTFYDPSKLNIQFAAVPKSNRDEPVPPVASKNKDVVDKLEDRKITKGIQREAEHDLKSDNLSKTYSIHEVTKESRAMSPENTDQEISHMTDLPSERDNETSKSSKKSQSEQTPRSPGENKATLTSTYTDSYTQSLPTSKAPTATDTAYSMSEGELPSPVKLVNKGYRSRNQSSDSTAQMHQTLQAIGEELARCRRMIMSTTSQESQILKSGLKDPSMPTTSARSSHVSLKATEGKSRIGDAYTPRVMFTLHIGTIVLSDEAVINSRDMSLVLTWQFYDQNVAMTRIHQGRVVHFDFSTEYDLKLTDDFLEYLKCEEMPIKICEVNRLEQPLASCSLPLREALLHTNRRADMSLALMAGSYMRRRHSSADPLDAGDETGVLDLWCMLRATPRLLPRINAALAKPKRGSIIAGRHNRGSIGTGFGAVMAQINEDELDDVRLSTDLEYLAHGKLPMLSSEVQSFAANEHQLTETYQARQERLYKHKRGSNPDRIAYGLDTISMDTKATTSAIEDKNIIGPSDSRWYDRSVATTETGDSSGIIVNEVSIPERTRTLSNVQNVHAPGAPMDDQIASNAKKSHRDSLVNFLNNSGSKQNAKSNGINPFKKVKLKKKSPDDIATQKTAKQKTQYLLNKMSKQSIDITILWLALNDECSAMNDSNVQRLYVAYTFLGRGGAELETPLSLPKPKHYLDKCYFNFKKTFELNEPDLPILARIAKCRSPTNGAHDHSECIFFTVVSEPVEDPLGMNNCEDIGNAYLYLGDLLSYSSDSDTYTEVIPVRVAHDDAICGVLAIKVDGLDVVRNCMMLCEAKPGNS